MRLIAEGTHVCGDPGMQFDTTINEWHTCPATDRIYASNPCSEYMFLNDSACNLASINLMKFVKVTTVEFDVASYKAAIRTLITAQEIIVDNASYPIAGDREEQPRLPAARARLREPGRAADVARPALRQRRRPRLRRGADGADDRRGVRAVGAHRPRLRRAVLRLRQEPRTVPPRDAQAPRRDARRQRAQRSAGSLRRGQERRGTTRWSSASSTATATPRRPCWRRPARSAS